MSHSGDSIPSAASTPHKRMQALSMSFSMSPSMFATPPRSASAVDRRYQGRYSEGSTAAADKEKGVNVQVILRCRPLSEDERKANCNQVVSCNDKKREVVVSYNTASKLIDKTFTFDKVFGPKSQQKSIYDQAISSFVTEVLDGYNCTIFAYGQTGTGKTYTMEGGGKMNYAKNGDLPVDAGVIPRAVRQIIDTLESQNADYSMKVTFLELYNEEITDLLANDDSSKNLDDKSRKPITLMEDGRGGVLVKGLEEEVVYSANEIFTLLHRGSSRRRTTETLQNKQSSRSHSIFSITIHIKETTPEGEELIKCGKLNLVDLAGSENISRSGARESGRTREAGEINKSLLTLGRVITSLVEHQVHVPYRDSKLTRLLRDSLGGKTKTCIIATVSPAAASMEETLNTLDYAHRAKSIRNRPEVNQRMMKSALIKDLYADIDRLKQEVRAAREKNGVYIPRELHLQDQAEKKATSEKIERLELEAESKNKFIQELQDLLKQEKQTNSDLMSKLETTEERLAETKEQLVNCQEKNKQANCTIKENEFIISNMLQSEKSLIEKASGMRLELENTARDVDGLFAKIARKAKIETGNHALVKEFRFKLSQHVDGLHSSVVESILQQQQHLTSMNEQLQSIISYKTQTTDKLKEKVEEIRGTHISSIKKLNLLAESLEEKSRSTFIDIDSTVSSQSSYLLDALSTAISKAERIIEELQSALKNQEERMVSFVRKQQEGTENTIESTRKISMTIIDFFKNLDEHACSLSKYIEQAQSNQAKRLEELHKSYKECSAQEHDNMMAKIAEIIGRSTATKLSLMETGVQNICDMAACNAHVLQERIGSLQNIASDAQHHWNTHVMQAEDNFVQSNTETENGHRELQGTLNDCATKTMLVRTHWKETKAEMVKLEEGNKKEVEHIIKNAQETNRQLTASISEAALSAETEANNGGQCLSSALTDSLVSERDSSQAIRSVLSECNNNISNMQKTHQDNAAVIGSEAEKYLKDDYLEDEATCSTPKKRSIQIPSLESLEKLQTPSVEELLQGFWEEEYENRTNLVNGEAKHLCSSSDATSTKDSRPPLAAINN